MEVKWIKIAVGIFEDDKIKIIESLPEADAILIIWFKLLCLAGKTNNDGVLMIMDGMPYTAKILSTVFGRKESVVNLALKTFENFGMIEIVNDVITIPKWGDYQNVEALERMKHNEYHKEKQREYRLRQKQIASGTPQESDISLNILSPYQTTTPLTDCHNKLIPDQTAAIPELTPLPPRVNPNDFNDVDNSELNVNNTVNLTLTHKEKERDKDININTPLPPCDRGDKLLGSKRDPEKRAVWAKHSAMFNPDLREAVLKWINYKAEKRQPYKAEGLNSLLVQIKKHADEYGDSAVITMIGNCMANNWQGISWDRIQSAPGSTPVSKVSGLNAGGPAKPNRFCNFTPRVRDYAELEKKERALNAERAAHAVSLGTQ